MPWGGVRYTTLRSNCSLCDYFTIPNSLRESNPYSNDVKRIKNSQYYIASIQFHPPPLRLLPYSLPALSARIHLHPKVACLQE